MGKLILVMGGVRSGKSSFAEQLTSAQGDEKLLYIATGQAWDDEMRERIRLHQNRRKEKWLTLEEAEDLPGLIRSLHDNPEERVGSHNISAILVETFTGWIANLMMSMPEDQLSKAETKQAFQNKVAACLDAIRGLDVTWIIVSDEVGLGGVASTKLGRSFQDIAGYANQLLASFANEVYFVVAGIPMNIKGASHS
ncbi:bifunctional adenosylcobinamide kinase/adenosylcobinamide-phosphate guanylyltransferase [Brevibacillus daliensis]|uniref:bifunctional adenosylcobinamide kinase/adenosylcobinamide-phosphate guanylyltransferase n=1 Tax=Brevibacillus daliensis TaxID=2892995 RepID=UPI001E48ED97|nr:bifunctional adenosylcobinamide kinase/adenosylcobinamide-phosphate guanylyltransferase [Brevibacillus daliensis]